MPKRLFDVFASAFGLILASPLMLAIAAAVRLESGGPAWFRQDRVGRGGKIFKILKFRSMYCSPHERGAELTAANDQRITAVGSFLRRTKLDELPQLINVLKGDMSLVGPRPEVARYVEMYPAAIRRLILSVRPGITDEASIKFRNEDQMLGDSAGAEQRYIEQILPLKLDLYASYARQNTFLGDLRILSRTLVAVVLHRRQR
jgi:lipopolysaccharide/colanic/teichoic acid biosynthesis glycosyltransferase